MVDVQAKEFGSPFHGGGLTEEDIIVPVFTVLKDKVADGFCDERPLCSGQRRIEPREFSYENLVVVKEKVRISEGGCRVSCQQDQSLFNVPA